MFKYRIAQHQFNIHVILALYNGTIVGADLMIIPVPPSFVIFISLNSRPFSSAMWFFPGWILIMPSDSNSWIYLWRTSSFTLLCPNSAVKTRTSCNCFHIAIRCMEQPYNIGLAKNTKVFFSSLALVSSNHNQIHFLWYNGYENLL